MAYSFQTFTTSQVLTSTQVNQIEVNIRDHVHGRSGVGSVADDYTVNSTFIVNSVSFGPIGGIASMRAGVQALSSITSSASAVIAVGYQAGYSNTTGGRNNFFGAYAGRSTTSSNNNFYGYSAGYNNTTGVDNLFFGNLSGYSNTIGSYNVAIGNNTLNTGGTGSYCTAAGYAALYNSTADGNTAFGYYALLLCTSGANNTAFGGGGVLQGITTGNYNTAIGWGAGATNLNSNNNITCIGYDAQFVTAGGNNQIVLGNSSIANLYCYDTTIASPSDGRDKTDIASLHLGEQFIRRLRPVSFVWDRRESYEDGIPDGTKKDIKRTAGFIAQELKSVCDDFDAGWTDVVNTGDPDKYWAKYGKLVPMMVQAMQEMMVRIDSLESQVSLLKRSAMTIN